ncbi:hypothetical protein J7I00_004438 [Vibrio parahaemolyticus]|nr:hypothetical protein [Vibrio parahaemolyticus]
MSTSVKSLVFSLLRENQVRTRDTSIFKNYKHNKDLVPKFSDNLNCLLELCGTYRHASYDIQGVRDKGVDILVIYENEEGETKRIGVQIKSFDDINEKDWLSKLKAQTFEATNSYTLQDFYVVFCTDEDIHRDKMRNAKADLVDIPSIHVVEPDKALNFFELSSVEIMARVQDAYRQGDKVIEDARDYFSERSLFEACVIIDIAIDSIIDGITTIDSAELINGHLVCKYLDRYNVVPYSVYLNESICVSEVSEYVIEPDEIFVQVMDEFSYSVYEEPKFEPSECSALAALVWDVMVRYSSDTDVIKEYVMHQLLSDKVEFAESFLLLD